jgi:hypothetical protein
MLYTINIYLSCMCMYIVHVTTLQSRIELILIKSISNNLFMLTTSNRNPHLIDEILFPTIVMVIAISFSFK